MQRKIGVISPSLPLKSEEEVETAVKRLENYGVSVEFFTTNDKLQDFMQAQVNEEEIVIFVKTIGKQQTDIVVQFAQAVLNPFADQRTVPIPSIRYTS